jgi:hypothetical protein
MRERASMTRGGSITRRPWEKPLAAVGKPYKLPSSSAVCGDLLALKRTLCDPENRSDSAWVRRMLCDLNKRMTYEFPPGAREVPHF